MHETMIAADCRIEGQLTGQVVRIFGQVTGAVEATEVIVEAGAQIGGGIHASGVRVLGRVDGAIRAERVIVEASGQSLGGISAPSVTLAEGYDSRTAGLQPTGASGESSPGQSGGTCHRATSVPCASAAARHAVHLIAASSGVGDAHAGCCAARGASGCTATDVSAQGGAARVQSRRRQAARRGPLMSNDELLALLTERSFSNQTVTLASGQEQLLHRLQADLTLRAWAPFDRRGDAGPDRTLRTGTRRAVWRDRWDDLGRRPAGQRREPHRCAERQGLPALIVRKEAKGHGAGRQVEETSNSQQSFGSPSLRTSSRQAARPKLRSMRFAARVTTRPMSSSWSIDLRAVERTSRRRVCASTVSTIAATSLHDRLV